MTASRSVWVEQRVAACTRDLDYAVFAPHSLSELRLEAAKRHGHLNPRARYDLMSDGVLIAHLRHEYTWYEANLREMRRRQGAVETPEVSERSYSIIREQTIAAIKNRFPELVGPPMSRGRRIVLSVETFAA